MEVVFCFYEACLVRIDNRQNDVDLLALRGYDLSRLFDESTTDTPKIIKIGNLYRSSVGAIPCGC